VSNLFGRSFGTPTGIHPDQLKLLREGIAKTLNDPEFPAEAKRRNLEIKPSAGKVAVKKAK
jgi:hypothetical protein